jgi:TolA-binding protein
VWRRRVALIGTAAAVVATTISIALWPGRARPANAEALYWKGTMGSSPADAQQALLTLVASFPQSPRVNDALVRLAQLQMARGARAEAIHSLLTLAERTPAGPSHGKTLLWIARVQLDGGDTTSACGSLRATLADSVAADADLSRQVESVGAACSTTRIDAVSSAPDSSGGTPR